MSFAPQARERILHFDAAQPAQAFAPAELDPLNPDEVDLEISQNIFDFKSLKYFKLFRQCFQTIEALRGDPSCPAIYTLH